MRFCASQSWEHSNQALKEQLTPETLQKWNAATQKVCAAAYAPYRQGTIYPHIVVGCDDRLNRVLLEELRGLSE
nr:lysozyme inhibitor LprI family protein [Synechococcus sp. UW86]